VRWWVVTTVYSPHEPFLVAADEWEEAIREYGSVCDFGEAFIEHLVSGAGRACVLSAEQAALLGLSSDGS